jgi:hypothetical protein
MDPRAGVQGNSNRRRTIRREKTKKGTTTENGNGKRARTDGRNEG